MKINQFLTALFTAGIAFSTFAAEDINTLTRKALQGNPDAQYELSQRYQYGINGVQKDFTLSLNWKEKAEKGWFNQNLEKYELTPNDADVQYRLSDHYLNGKGVKQDVVKGIELLKKAAKQNHAAAQNNLGMIYFTGEKARQDLHQAKTLFGLACDNGSTQGCKNYQHEKLQNLTEINPLERIFNENRNEILVVLGAIVLVSVAFVLGKRSNKKQA